MVNILGDFYEKLPGDKTKRRLDRDFNDQEKIWDEEAESEKKTEAGFKDDRRRPSFIWLYIILSMVFLVLFVRLWSLQITQGAHFRYLAEGNRIRTKNISAQRGIIYDRSGQLLVRNTAGFNIEIYPIDLSGEEKEREVFYEKISTLIGLSSKKIKKEVEKENINPFDPVVIKEKVEREKALILKEKLAEIPGIAVVESSARDYKNRWALSHILGYVGNISEEDTKDNSDSSNGKAISYYITDYIGKAGLEAALEQELKGVNGKQQVEVDASGKIVRIMAEREATPGNNLITSIDLGLQKKVYQILKRAVKKHKGKGVVIAANPQNGEILAMVSLPDYNNNIFTKLSGDKFSKQYQRLVSDKNNPMFNRAIAGIYPPGSTIKPMGAAAALQEKIIDINTHIKDPGIIEVPNKYDPDIIYKFRCWKREGHGWVNVVSAIEQSCDTFFYGVGGGYDKIPGLGIKKIKKYYNLFGYGKELGIDLTGEAAGLVPDPEWKEKVKNEGWYLGDNYMLAIGQGDLLVTPLQLLMGTVVIANGGELVRPRIVKEIISPSGETIKKFSKEVIGKRFILAKNIDIVRQGMRAVVVSGTATGLSDLPVSSAGKTGTAEYNNKKDQHAWYTAFAPYEDPKIALVVLVEGGGEGSDVAAPIAKEILNYYFTRK